ncbi:MAG: hypothetical protein B7X90_14260 [Novosphingobium sp. 17-62-19]|uniref:hypothetical protein n=1 Tax=Novosphingobium sp. 17-62-19 TaxID=1970406 RepID=UPI000BCDCB25|nr:hypothetical protein [Novosphingobium sp. 17-62-19]OZA17643.1 MAG: hypothetical protein B7X90_14260 [Novosphingobium sp. 17-62-19]OZA72833.1 MAG: hypothetical protein B7X78_00135 [Sphingomonadales bacterium 39-62-4]
MKRLAFLLLLIGAVLGLAAQTPARALAPDADAKVAAAIAAMPDCMEKMDHKAPDKPCGCTKADCIAAMLGAAPLFTAAALASSLGATDASASRPIAERVAPLAGQNLGPEPPPPNHLI